MISIPPNKSWLTIVMMGLLCLGSNNMNFVYAGSDTQNLSISATIHPKCNFTSGGGPSGTTVDFGVYDPLVTNATEADSASSSISALCTKNTPAQIAMGTGLYASYASGNGATRAMTDGQGDYISYEIYIDPGMSTVWNTTNTVSYTNTGGGSTTLPIYGSIPPGQNASAGNYSDTVQMTITY